MTEGSSRLEGEPPLKFYPAEAVFEVYKMYARESEDVAARRRAYTIALFPTSAALLVGPFFAVGDDRTTIEAFLIAAFASLAGVILSLLWSQILFRYRRLIQHRGYWLILLERYLGDRKYLPPVAQVFTFEWRRLFRYKSSKCDCAGDGVKINISLTAVEQQAVTYLYGLFLMSPLLVLALACAHRPLDINVAPTCAAIWCGIAVLVGIATWRKVALDNAPRGDDPAVDWARDKILPKASRLLADADWKAKLFAGATPDQNCRPD